jgi:hypothetical protein
MDSRLDAFLKTRSSCQCLEIFLRPSSGLFRETHRNDWHVGRAETSLRVFKRALCRRRSVPAVVVNPAGTGQFHSREPGSLAQRRGSAAGISANAREQQSTQIASNRPSRQTRRNNIRGQRIPPKRGGHCPTDPDAAAFGGSAQAIGAAQAAAAISNGRSRSFAADQLHLRLTDHANPRPICLGSAVLVSQPLASTALASNLT